MPKKGLEPPHPCEYVDLNHARLPIPPLRLRKTTGARHCPASESVTMKTDKNYISIETNVRRIVKRGWLPVYGYRLSVEARAVSCLAAL